MRYKTFPLWILTSTMDFVLHRNFRRERLQLEFANFWFVNAPLSSIDLHVEYIMDDKPPYYLTYLFNKLSQIHSYNYLLSNLLQ